MPPDVVVARVVVTRPIIGICYMQVCAVADATDEQVSDLDLFLQCLERRYRRLKRRFHTAKMDDKESARLIGRLDETRLIINEFRVFKNCAQSRTGEKP